MHSFHAKLYKVQECRKVGSLMQSITCDSSCVEKYKLQIESKETYVKTPAIYDGAFIFWNFYIF